MRINEFSLFFFSFYYYNDNNNKNNKKIFLLLVLILLGKKRPTQKSQFVDKRKVGESLLFSLKKHKI